VRVDLYLGMISGTSVDGIDAALVAFADHSVELLATQSHAYPDALKARLLAAIRSPAATTVDEVGALDTLVGRAFRDAALALIESSGQHASDVKAIGSHGQTLRHRPDNSPPFTLQLGDPATIATGTGITTVADFRRQDLALGGQGAPLVPPFHDWLFGDGDTSTVVANIGGIANITILPGNGRPLGGFDTGPGNTLMDAWTRRHRDQPFDAGGGWAATGMVDEALLHRLLDDDYFTRPPPKSTGFEHFNLDWLAAANIDDIDPADVQATLLEMTARSLATAIVETVPDCATLALCGGGVHNRSLVARIQALLPSIDVISTASRGLDPDWVEAAAFAWLARERMAGRFGNAPTVTGARRRSPLGAIYRA
jgi:anhydro-N-acetylmuramic acid kinase